MEHFSKKLEIRDLKNDIQTWLLKETKPISRYLNRISLFGSVARDSFKPNDCDIFFVMIPEHSESQWAFIRNNIPKIKLAFTYKFDLPLSTILLTYNEWIEFQDFFGYEQISIFQIYN